MTDTEKTATFPLNESSSVTQFTGGSKGNSEIFFKVESFITPGVVYRCDLKKGNFDCEVSYNFEVTMAFIFKHNLTTVNLVFPGLP